MPGRMKELGSYIIDRPLGRGATAQVYRATGKNDPACVVALKVFHPGLWDQEVLQRRAMTEFQAVSTMYHPNIVRVLEPLWNTEPPAVAMEFIDGYSLEEFQSRLPYVLPEIAALVAIEILRALEYAHAKGIIHRDLKPANILISKDGRALVSDFGLAKISDVSRMTMSGTILGSPDYMSPEQTKGDVCTEKSDLFSVSSILYFLVTGTRPFSRPSPLATLAAVNSCEVEPATRRNPKLSAALSEIIHRNLACDPAARYSSARGFREAIERYLHELGLAHEQFNFALWMRRSSEVMLNSLTLISDELVRRAEKRISAKDLDGALETLSHLSIVAPESAALARLMNHISQLRQRGRSRKQWTIRASSAAAIAVMIGVSFAVYQRTQTHLPVVNAPVAAPQPQAAPLPKAPPQPELSTVRFDVMRGVQVYWDDREIDPRNALPGVSPGRHRVRLEKAGAKPIVQVVTVRANEPTKIRVR